MPNEDPQERASQTEAAFSPTFSEAETAIFDEPHGVARCTSCSSKQLQSTKLRVGDIRYLFLFQCPVRCGRCGKRQYTTPLIAALARRNNAQLKRIRRKTKPETWAAWTDVPHEEKGKSRPMTTVLGPRAQRLQPLSRLHKAASKPEHRDE